MNGVCVINTDLGQQEKLNQVCETLRQNYLRSFAAGEQRFQEQAPQNAGQLEQFRADLRQRYEKRYEADAQAVENQFGGASSWDMPMPQGPARGDEVMANNERLRRMTAGQPDFTTQGGNPEDERRRIRRQRQAFYDNTAMSLMTSVRDDSGWVPT